MFATSNGPKQLTQIGLRRLSSLLILGLWVGTMYWAYARTLDRGKFGILFLTATMTIYLLNEINDKLDNELSLKQYAYIFMLLVMIVFTIATSTYTLLNFDELAFERFLGVRSYEYVLAGGVLFTVVYITARAYGLGFAGFIVAVMLYGLYGNLAPGILYHQGIPYDQFVLLSVLNISGIYGNLIQITAAWVMLFLLYAGFIIQFGGMGFIVQALQGVVKHLKSGVAQMAVVLSMVVGSVSGAASANVGITGSITIPLMKEDGINPNRAGGIEAVASTGGQILPPVMGVAAFLMVDFVGIPYSEVVVLALVPALVFYVTVAFAVRLIALDEVNQIDNTQSEIGIDDENIDQPHVNIDNRQDFAFQTIRFGVPFLILLWALVIAELSVTLSGLIAASSMLVFGSALPVLRNPSRETTKQVAQRTYNGFIEAADTAVPLMAVVAAIGVVVEVIFTTGVTSLIVLQLLELSGGVFIVAMAIALGICILLGFGMPTVAAYTLVAVLIAPDLVSNFDLPEIAVHFFVLYGAVLSNITPPVAFAVVVATGVARSNFWKTGVAAMKVGIALFVLPFVFVIHPDIFTASLTSRLYLGIIVLGGMTMITFSLLGSVDRGGKTINYASRLVVGIIGMYIIFSDNLALSMVLVLAGLTLYLGYNLIEERFNSLVEKIP